MKSDIQNRDDIDQLVRAFYKKLLNDEMLGLLFTEVAQIDVLEHLDVIGDFWESALLQAGKYKGHTMDVHLELHQKYRLEEAHFDRWLELFNESLNELFEGKKAGEASYKALTIAAIIKAKIDHLEKTRIELSN